MDEETNELLSSWEELAGTTIPRMTEEDLKKFVLDYCDGHIFTSAHLRQHNQDLLPLIFMPVALGSFAGLSEDLLKLVGLLWEHMSKALPRSVNGCPTFMSVRVMHKDDWEHVRPAISREIERRQNIEL